MRLGLLCRSNSFLRRASAVGLQRRQGEYTDSLSSRKAELSKPTTERPQKFLQNYEQET